MGEPVKILAELRQVSSEVVDRPEAEPVDGLGSRDGVEDRLRPSIQLSVGGHLVGEQLARVVEHLLKMPSHDLRDLETRLRTEDPNSAPIALDNEGLAVDREDVDVAEVLLAVSVCVASGGTSFPFDAGYIRKFQTPIGVAILLTGSRRVVRGAFGSQHCI
jgi:hypothetical protein